MTPKMKARTLAATGAILGGTLVMLPIPMLDVLMLLPVQALIATGVTWLMGRPVGFKRLAKLVLLWSVVGGFLGLALEVCILFIGKLLLIPLSALWCFLLGELLIHWGPAPAK